MSDFVPESDSRAGRPETRVVQEISREVDPVDSHNHSTAPKTSKIHGLAMIEPPLVQP